MEKQYKVGDEIEFYCRACRLNLDGNVYGLKDEKVDMVMCRTCFKPMRYQPPVDMAARRDDKVKKLMRALERKKREDAGDPVVVRKGSRRIVTEQRQDEATPGPLAPTEEPSPQDRWRTLTADADARRAKVWRPADTYKPGDFLLHKKWGMGYIETVADEGLLVLFREGPVPLFRSEEGTK